MGKLTSLGLLVLAAACSAGGEAEPPVTCAQSDRQGTYLLRFDEQSGSCGAVGDVLVQSGAPTPGTNCMFNAEPRWSDADCTVETSSTCEDTATGQTVTTVGITTQRDSAGELLTGTATMTVRNAQGVVQCASTYGLRYERQ